jgi:hypothetical protein
VFDSSIFDVVIGLVFVFFVFSLAVSGINEFVRKLLNTRAKALWTAISAMLDDTTTAPQPEGMTVRLQAAPLRTSPDVAASSEAATVTEASLAQRVYDHPMVARLDPTQLNKPTKITDIPSSAFARALVDVLTPRDGNGQAMWDELEGAIRNLPAPLRAQFEILWVEADRNMLQFRQAVESWFDASMERVSDWYKKRTRVVMVLYGLLVAAVFNVSAIGITTELYENDVVRETVTALAANSTAAIEAIDDCTNRECVEEKVASIVDTGLPVWWRECPKSDESGGTAVCGFESFPNGLVSILGWFITAAALSLGASFWFAVLKKALKLKPSKSGSA